MEFVLAGRWELPGTIAIGERAVAQGCVSSRDAGSVGVAALEWMAALMPLGRRVSWISSMPRPTTSREPSRRRAVWATRRITPSKPAATRTPCEEVDIRDRGLGICRLPGGQEGRDEEGPGVADAHEAVNGAKRASGAGEGANASWPVPSIGRVLCRPAPSGSESIGETWASCRATSGMVSWRLQGCLPRASRS